MAPITIGWPISLSSSGMGSKVDEPSATSLRI